MNDRTKYLIYKEVINEKELQEIQDDDSVSLHLIGLATILGDNCWHYVVKSDVNYNIFVR
jgi:hypothetical protein